MAGKPSKEGLVSAAAGRMKEMILAREPDAQIGSLPDVAKALGVGVVTVQQAARVLEHEGFLKVRRGNGGGYYGARPNAASLGRAIAGFLQVNQTREHEAIEIMTLLDCDLISAAALATDETLRARLRDLGKRIDACDTAEQRGAFEQEMQDIIYAMVDRPLMEMLARVTMEHYSSHAHLPIYPGTDGAERWKQERHNIIYAILRGDPGLARFEAQRRREDILERLAKAQSMAGGQ
ncbi:DNA-binding FadR family transcriptional regulator [Novosphingobium sp. PhB165]|uniref:FCD domain-containing protein n=1 Tax=Novosphingobium sp. PhB165 TaxID=2485105 RepID=UPI00104D1058|nr:FCD domain-containing protein [Novosphingobium sp. PhB165]TCM20390.1 DNA-binding FadR family transcriptional regulator [Novosphingobium sp. PhB165]